MPIALGDRARRHRATAPHPPASILADWAQYKRNGSVAARNRLVEFYMRSHVRPIALRIHAGLPQQVDADDLVQQGYLGLVDAMDRYDTDRETSFETFSRRRIFGAIQDYLRAIDPVPRLTRLRSKKVQRLRDGFLARHGRPPTDDELRAQLQLPEAQFRRVIAAGHPAMMVPFSHVASASGRDDGHDADAMDSFEDRGSPAPSHEPQRRDLQRWLTRGLDDRDRLIVILYYYEQMTMHEVGRTIGISESRVSQRLESILACLRSRLVATGAEWEFVGEAD